MARACVELGLSQLHALGPDQHTEVLVTTLRARHGGHDGGHHAQALSARLDLRRDLCNLWDNDDARGRGYIVRIGQRGHNSIATRVLARALVRTA